MRYDYVDTDYPEHPYPGTRPDQAFLDIDRGGYWLHRDGEQWRTSYGDELDTALAGLGAAPLADRFPILAYGSNENPSKITWLRQALGLTGPVIALPVLCVGLASVWCKGIRPRDGSRPVVLAADESVTERHAVWLATNDQRRVLDRCEDRGRARRLVELHHPIVTVHGGDELKNVLAYTAAPEACGPDVPADWNRSPLLIDGQYASMYDYGQHDAAQLTGDAADSDGIDCTTVPED